MHSVIIGLALGVNTHNRPVARNYMIALCFHQLVEAVALGAFIAMADIGQFKSEWWSAESTDAQGKSEQL